MNNMNAQSNVSNGIYRDILINLFIIVLVFLVYLQVKDFEFINFDDNEYIYENRHVQKGLTPESILWAFTSTHAANWHPLTWLSHLLDVSLFGVKAGMHHLTNVIFHLFNSILLYLVFRMMTGHLWKSFIVAALFALHPIHVESVAWIAERKDVLSTFFWFLTMLCYLWYAKSPDFRRYLSVLLFYTLGLMSKPMLVTLPFVLLLLDYWPLKRFDNFTMEMEGDHLKNKVYLKNLIIEKIPLFILAAGSSFITFFVQKSGKAVVAIGEHPLGDRLANAVISYASYMGKMIWPFNLAIFYPYPSSFSIIRVTGAIFLLIAITIAVVKFKNQHKYLVTGWLWYIGTLVPVIGLVQVGSQAMADRYSYVPLIGLFIIVVWGISAVSVKWRNRNIMLSITTAVIFSIFINSSWVQTSYWMNSITLFQHALDVTADNHMAHTNLAVALEEKGRIEEAQKHYSKALSITPYDKIAHNNIGKFLIKQGRTDEALDHYFEALCIDPDYARAHFNIGIAMERQGEKNKAIEYFLNAVDIELDYLEAYIHLGYIEAEQGRIDQAIHYYSEALRIDPDLKTIHFNIGIALVKKRRFTEAISHYSKVLRLQPEDAEVHNNIGTALIRIGEIEKAVYHFREALRIKPGYTIASKNLSNTLAARKKSLERNISGNSN